MSLNSKVMIGFPVTPKCELDVFYRLSALGQGLHPTGNREFPQFIATPTLTFSSNQLGNPL